MLISADATFAARVRQALLRALDGFAVDSERIHAVLDAMQKQFPAEPAVAEFATNAKAAHESQLEAAYQKIINPRRGRPCCPACGSPNIAEIGGAYEFAQMHCYDCDNDEYCDPYQVGDWYR